MEALPDLNSHILSKAGTALAEATNRQYAQSGSAPQQQHPSKHDTREGQVSLAWCCVRVVLNRAARSQAWRRVKCQGECTYLQLHAHMALGLLNDFGWQRRPLV